MSANERTTRARAAATARWANQAERLTELLEDSPLNDEPLTADQARRVDELMGRRGTSRPRRR